MPRPIDPEPGQRDLELLLLFFRLLARLEFVSL